MNLTHPLKYRYYTYRKLYLLYILLFLAFLFITILSFRHLTDFYKYISVSLLLITFAYTIINSVYEFTVLINHYLSLKTIKLEFLGSSIIYSIINAIIQVTLIFISYFVIKEYNPQINQVFTLNTFGIYLFTFLIHLSLFAFIGIISLILKNIKYVQILLYTILLTIVALISFEIANSVINFVRTIYANTTLLFKLNPIIIILTAILWCLIYLKIKKYK